MTETKSAIKLVLKNTLKVVLFLFLAQTLSNFAAEFEVIDVSEINTKKRTDDHYHYLLDETLSLGINQVSQSTNWKIPLQGVTNRGFSASATWMKFALSNSSNADKRIIVEYVESSIKRIDLYQRRLNSAEDFEHQYFSFEEPIEFKKIAFYRPSFQVDIPAHQIYEIYLRILPGDDFPMHSFSAMHLSAEKTFYYSSHLEIASIVGLLVAEFLMGIASLLVYLATRDKIFLYYSFFAISVAGMFASFSGILSYFIFPGGYNLRLVVFHIALVQISAMQFVRSFLNLKVHANIIDKVFFTAIVISLLGILLNIVGLPYYSRSIIDYMAFSFVLIIPTGIYAAKKGVKHAYLFTFSWFIFVVGMLFSAFRLRGYISDSFWAQWTIYFGGFIEVILLTTIMISRLKDLRLAKEAAEIAHQKILLTAANDLVQKVNIQTEQLKQAKEAAEKEARSDSLTGLLNRRAFTESANQFISRARRAHSSQLHLAMIDVDHFKSVNDTYGHAAGDLMLKKLSTTLSKTIRETDCLARMGGEEFAVIMENKEPQGAEILVERLRQNVEDLVVKIDGKNLSVSISIGVSTWSEGYDLDKFLLIADRALYQAKDLGRNKVIFSERE